MEFRLIAAALLFNGDDVLMMKRSEKRTLSPGLWATVGGHVEPHELAKPMQACYREIYEETGFTPSDVGPLNLRYILMRNHRGENRQQFIYEARVTRRDFHITEEDEGELHWIPVGEMLNRPLPFTFQQMLQHYLSNLHSPHVWMGIMGRNAAGDLPCSTWTPLIDPLA